jgi:hypothetical protein
MAKKKVNFEVKTKGTIKAYWLAVDNDDVRLTNGKGSVDVDGEGLLVWWMSGTSGSSITIKGTVGTKVVIDDLTSKIPKGEKKGSGKRKFNP